MVKQRKERETRKIFKAQLRPLIENRKSRHPRELHTHTQKKKKELLMRGLQRRILTC